MNESAPYTGNCTTGPSGVTVPTNVSRLEELYVKATSLGGISNFTKLNLEICGLETIQQLKELPSTISVKRLSPLVKLSLKDHFVSTSRNCSISS